MFDRRPLQPCPTCKLTGGLVYQVRYYEIHLHQPLGPPLFGFIQPQYRICTSFLEDAVEGCNRCGHHAQLSNA
jgi:hypothetical protein